jgi:hypothetical protein
MDAGARARPLRLSRRLRRLSGSLSAGRFLLFVVLIAVAVFILFISVLSTHVAGVVRVAGIVVLVLSPALTFAAVLCAPRVVRAVWRRLVDHRDDTDPQPDGPPIERLAADLRRLLWQHERVTRSADAAMWSGRLRALEGAISICAMQAARSLDVPYPGPPIPGGVVHKPQLRRLLRALAAAGLVVPLEVGLLAPDPRH